MHDIITTNQPHTTYLGKVPVRLTRLDSRHPPRRHYTHNSLGIVTVAPNDATSPPSPPRPSPLPGPYSRTFCTFLIHPSPHTCYRHFERHRTCSCRKTTHGGRSLPLTCRMLQSCADWPGLIPPMSKKRNRCALDGPKYT